jgi:ABC-type bacteriocin/lantibiotic exporter with double-glycine peptidase domain
LEKPQFFRLLFRYFFLSRKNWILFPLTIFWFAVSEGLAAYISNFLLYEFSLARNPDNSFFHDFGKVYALIAFCIFILLLVRTYFLNLCIKNSNKQLFKRAMGALVYAALPSFQRESSGSSLDKLSQDIGMLDSNISANLEIDFIMFFQCFYNMAMLVLFKPVLIIFGILIVAGSYFVYAYCAPVVLSERKLSLALKGTPILNRFSELMKGHKTIKIYGLERSFLKKVEEVLMESMRSVVSYHKTLLTFKFYNQNVLLIFEIAFLLTTVQILLTASIGTFCSSLISLFGIFLYFDWMLCESIVINNVLTAMERLLAFIDRKELQGEFHS